MLLTRAANRLKAYLEETYADLTVDSSGMVIPIRPRCEGETTFAKYLQDDVRVTLSDSKDIQFIIRSPDGSFNPIETGGTGQNYRQTTNLVLIAYAKDLATLERLQPALTQVRELRLVRFQIEPQAIAQRYLNLVQDFNFKRPLVALELTYTEIARGPHCEALPAATCAPVEIYKDGELIATQAAGTAYLYETEECPPADPVLIQNQDGETIAEVDPGGTYPVWEFDTIQNSLTSDGVIVNTI